MSEILTRLNAKVQSYTDSGGKAELTPQDIAAACAGTTDIGLHIALARICGSREAQVKAFYPILREVAGMAARGGWKIPKGKERLRSLTQLAVFEATNHQACPTCRGTQQNPKNPAKPCATCRGTGLYVLQDQERAASIGISKQAWSQTWQRRYEDIKLFIEDQEHAAIRAIHRKLTDW